MLKIDKKKMKKVSHSFFFIELRKFSSYVIDPMWGLVEM